MSQISKRWISKEVEDRIFEVFWESLASCSTKKTVADFLEDLLTPTEKIVLAKRVSIALLLLKGYDYKRINNLLKVSDPTIWIVKLWLKTKGKGYRLILEKIIRSEQMEKFWQEIESKVENVLPPRPGSNWSEIRFKQMEKRRNRMKAF